MDTTGRQSRPAPKAIWWPVDSHVIAFMAQW
jgi:hypothetical protein